MISVPERFTQIAEGSVRPLDWRLDISFTRQLSPDIQWFTLDQSLLDSGDLLSLSDTQSIQPWDAYDYKNYSSKLISVDVENSIEFPYSIQSAIADLVIDNTNGEFTYGGNSEVAQHILPSRPVRVFMGFKGGGVVPVFVGLTQDLPDYSGINDSRMTWSAMDFLTQLTGQSLESSIVLQNKRTDEVLDYVFKQLGLDASMYSLQPGQNDIPFFYAEAGANVGDILRKLIQAEDGKLWLSETGVIQFEPRSSELGKESVMDIDTSNIVEYSPSRASGIVNRVIINSSVRKVQENQEIADIDNANGYDQSSDNDSWRVPENGTLEKWVNFEDPIWSANVNPALNGVTTSSYFNAKTTTGATVSANVTIVGTLFGQSAKLIISNANNYPISISKLVIFGEPAKVVEEIKYDQLDSDSIEKFGTHELKIEDNNYFGSRDDADAFARHILSTRSTYTPTIKVVIKGNPALQLGDVVTLRYKAGGKYQVVKKKESLSQRGLRTELTLERFEELETFVLDQSLLNSTDVLSY